MSVTVERTRSSAMAAGLADSEILKIAADIRALAAAGKQVCNLTVGDFSPSEFRIPRFLEDNIKEGYTRGETTYPPSDGMLVLRKAVRAFYERQLGLVYPVDSVLITAGSRPGIYATYRALLDPGDLVVYGIPSWNTHHYAQLCGAKEWPVVCSREDAFLPTRKTLEPAIGGARLLALNSPLNPTGTAFARSVLEEICDLVLEENARRSTSERPLFLLYDQISWMLTYRNTVHVDPVSLRGEMAPYTVYVDSISKAFAATGVRCGWTVGPVDLTGRMARILSHVGAWPPRPEQVALARFLSASDEVRAYQTWLRQGLQARLELLYNGLMSLCRAGLPVDAIAPMGAMYLSARFDLRGMTDPSGAILRTNEEIREYLLHAAGLAMVPFQAFGAKEETGWFRLSVGAVSPGQIAAMMPRLRSALEALGNARAEVQSPMRGQ